MIAAAADAGIECDLCGRDCKGRVVTLELDVGKVRWFCDDRCERRWTKNELIRLRRYLRRIHNACRGRAVDWARLALNTDTPP